MAAQAQANPIDLGSGDRRGAIVDALRKLHPRTMAKNPVMFVVEVGSVLTTVRLALRRGAAAGLGFELQITFWLWLTCCSRTSPRRWPKGAGRRRPTRCARRDRDPRESSRA
jgi:high-affinity K+ transport system ATPase subunit B